MNSTQDRLDIFLELMQQKDRENLSRGHPSENLYNMLCNMYYYHDAFFFMYENIPVNLRPDWNKDEHFRNIFMTALKKTDDDFFNHYFFQGLDTYSSVEEIRAYSLDRPNNQKLKELSVELDNPVKIDKIMKALLTFYGEDEERFENLWQKSQTKLKGLNKINKKKSHALDATFYLFQAIAKKEGFEKANERFQSIDLNIISVASIIKHAIVHGFSYSPSDEFVNFFYQNEATIKQLTQNASELGHQGQCHPLNIFADAFHIYNVGEFMDSLKNEPDIALYLWELMEQKTQALIAEQAFSLSQNWQKYGVDHGSEMIDKIACLIKEDNPKFFSYIDKINLTTSNQKEIAQLIEKNRALVKYLRLNKKLDENVPCAENTEASPVQFKI
jgi:hypothetical protein